MEDTFDSSLDDADDHGQGLPHLGHVQGLSHLDHVQDLPHHDDVAGLEVDSTSQSQETDKGNKSEYPEGSLVWAHQTGYCFWPGLVTTSQSRAKNPGQTHVHFFGYENDFAWIPNKSVVTFRGVDHFEKLAAETAHWQREDLIPENKFQESFRKATILAERLLPIKVEDRIQTFGLSSPLIRKTPSKASPSTTPQAKESAHKFPNLYPQILGYASAWRDLTDNVDTDQFPLGSLVWAKMSGYPFWPSIVALSFEGIYKRPCKSGMEYYCQFFNWNNECAWVKKVEPWSAWTSINSKHFLTPAEQKSWRPPLDSTGTKWSQAVSEAEEIFKQYGEKKIHEPAQEQDEDSKAKLPTVMTRTTTAPPEVRNPEANRKRKRDDSCDDISPSDHSSSDPFPSDHSPSDHTPSDSHSPSDPFPSDLSASDHSSSDHSSSDHSSSDHSSSDHSSSDPFPSDHPSSDHSPSDRFPSIVLTSWTGKEASLDHPWLGPCFQTTTVPMVKLPYLFLSMQTVVVKGSLDEMVFSDLSGRSVATKITRPLIG